MAEATNLVNEKLEQSSRGNAVGQQMALFLIGILVLKTTPPDNRLQCLFTTT